MATLRIRIEAGRIVSSNGVYFEGIYEDGLKAVGNGWKVTIRPATKKRPGRIIAHCERNYSDGLAVCHREFRLEDGLLGLAGGNVYDRYAYFRKASFQKFLDEFGITAVKHEDPNQVFTGFAAYSGWGKAYQSVESDGEVEYHYLDDPNTRAQFNQPGANPNLYTGEDRHIVSGATWAIVEKKEDYRDNHNFSRILYTLEKDVTKLAPELRERKARQEKIQKLERAMDYSFKKDFSCAAEMRVFVEKYVGPFHPTLAELSGMAIREPGGYWNEYSFQGIRFKMKHPADGSIKLECLDEADAEIKYTVRLLGRNIELLANGSELAKLAIDTIM